MAFITKADISRSLLEEELDEITRSDQAIIDNAISTAIAEMKSHLYDWYDTETIFDATGTERDSLLVQFAVDIAIYNIVAILQAGQDTDDREARYKRALAWLKAASKPIDSKDRIYPDLPLREKTKSTKILSNSRAKRNNYY